MQRQPKTGISRWIFFECYIRTYWLANFLNQTHKNDFYTNWKHAWIEWVWIYRGRLLFENSSLWSFDLQKACFRILKLAQRFVKIFFLVSFPTSLENDLPTFTLRISQCKYFSLESIDGDRCLWLRFPSKSKSRMKFCWYKLRMVKTKMA